MIYGSVLDTLFVSIEQLSIYHPLFVNYPNVNSTLRVGYFEETIRSIRPGKAISSSCLGLNELHGGYSYIMDLASVAIRFFSFLDGLVFRDF